VPIFVDRGAPFAYKTANPGRDRAVRKNRLLQHVFPPDDPDLTVIDFDPVDDSPTSPTEGVG
jgi:hypothetical protein